MGFVVLLVSAAVNLAAYLLTPKTRNPRPDIAGVKPPSTQVGQPIPVVFGTMRLGGLVAWWGNARAQQHSSKSVAPGTYDYGFDQEVVYCMGPVDAILDFTVNDHSLVQYTQQRHYVNQWGNPVKNTPILVQYLAEPVGASNTFPLRFGTFPAGFAQMIVDAPKLLGGPASAGGLSQVWFDWYLGGPGQAASGTMARLIGNVLASSPSGTPVPQPLYKGVCYMVSYADPNPDNTSSGHYGTSPIPPNFAAVIQRCPKTLSTALGHPEYATFSTYDANPVEALYSAATSAEFQAGLKPLLQIPFTGIDVSSFETACATIYTEALLGSNPGPAIARSYLSNEANKGNGTFSNIAGALGAPTETITVTFTSATAFTVTGSVSGPLGTGTVGNPFTSAAISFLITAGIIAFIASDYFQFFVTQIASAGISDAIGVPDATAAEEWFRGVLTAIDGVMFTHPETSLLTLKLVRSDYTLADQPLVDESVYGDSVKYVEGSWPQTFNEVSVRYRNRGVDYTAPVTAAGDAWAMTQGVATIQNIAALQANGGIPQLAEPLDLPMLTNGLAAAVCAARALRTVSVPRAKASWLQNRTAHAFTPGMVVRLSCKRFGVTQKAMRITSADYGTMEDGKIRIEAVEDSFVTRPPIFSIDPGVPVATGGGGGTVSGTGGGTSATTLAITPSPVTIQVGQSVTFTVTALSAGVPVTDTFGFSTADATIASVNGSGTALGVAIGTTTIAVFDPFGNRATAVVTVVAAASPVLDHLVLTPATATIAVGATVTYVATGVDQFGAPFSITPVYTSGTTGVGTINSSSGVALGVAVGTSVITATAGGQSVTATLTVATVVIPPPPGGVVVLPADTYLTAVVPALAGGGSGLPVLEMRMRFLVDPLLTVITGPAQDFEFMGIGDGVSSVTFGVGAEIDSAGNCTIVCTGFLPRFTIPQSTLPAAGSYLILVAGLNAGAGVFAVELINDAGTVLGSASGSWSGNTNPAYTTVMVGTAGTGAVIAGGFTADGVEVLTTPLASPNAIPSLADTGVIELATFDLGTLAALVGTAFTPAFTSGSAPPTFVPGGIWGTAASGTPVLSGIVVSPAAASVAVGGAVTYAATPVDQFGNPITDPNPITFTSSIPGDATVGSSSGIAAGVAPGLVTITASDGTFSGTATLTIGGGGGGTSGVPPGQEVGFATDINGGATPGYPATITAAAPGGIGVESVASQMRYVFPTATSASTPAFAPASMDAQLAAQLAVGNINELYTFQGNAASPYDVPWYHTYITDITSAKAVIVAMATAMMNRWKDSVDTVNAMNEAMLGGGYCPNAFRDGWTASGQNPDDYTTGVIPFILNTFHALAPSMNLMLNFGHLNTDAAQRAGVLALYTGIKATATPASVMLNRVGDEHHNNGASYNSGLYTAQLPGYTTFANSMDALGVALDFTEFDYTDNLLERAAHTVPGPEFPADFPTRDSVFAKIITLYGNFRAGIPNAGRWIFWGLLSERSWLWKLVNAGTPFNRTDGQEPRALLLNGGIPTAPAAAFLALYPTVKGIGVPASPPPPTGDPNMPSGMTIVMQTGKITTVPVGSGTWSTGGPTPVNWQMVSGTLIRCQDDSVDVQPSGVRAYFPVSAVNDPAVWWGMPGTFAHVGTGWIYARFYVRMKPGATYSDFNAAAVKIIKLVGPASPAAPIMDLWELSGTTSSILWNLQGATTNYNVGPGAPTSPIVSGIWRKVAIVIKPNSALGAADGVTSLYIDDILMATRTGIIFESGTMQWTNMTTYTSRTIYGGGTTQSVETYMDFDDYLIGVK